MLVTCFLQSTQVKGKAIKIICLKFFLSRQGIAFRGDHDETDSNFILLLKLRGIDDPSISQQKVHKSPITKC